MAHAMSQIKATANAHMQRDIETEGKWVCECKACHGIRSLMGVEKMLEVRPLVRGVEQIEEKLHGLADGPEKRILLNQYGSLQDKLAAVVAR